MNAEIASIWIKVGGRGRRTTLVCGVYRDHTLLLDDAPENSGHITMQKARWKNFARQWKNAASVKSCWVMGDLNLDVMKWNSPEDDHEEMIEIIKNEIETENFHQLVDQPTRFWPNQTSSGLDHIWTNNLDKVVEVRNMIRAVSDHNVITIKIRTKGENNTPSEILTRNKINFNDKIFKTRVKNLNWSELYKQSNVSVAYNLGKFKKKKKKKNWMDLVQLT